MEKIKVLHIITSLNYGGAEMMLYKLLYKSSKEKFDCSVICLMPKGPIGSRIENIGIPVHYLNFSFFKEPFSGLIKLIFLLRKINPRIIQTWLYHSDLVGIIVSKLFKVENIVWNIRCSEMDLTKYNKTTRWCINLCKIFSKFPDTIITNSYTARKDHIKFGYNENNFRVIPNGFDTNLYRPNQQIKMSFRKKWKIGIDHICIGMVCRYDPKKDHKNFFKAINNLQKKYLPYIFLFGDNISYKNREIRNLMQIPIDTSRIFLIGPCNDMQNIFPALDLCVSSSAFGEGFPNVIGEAMSCGVPCVVTDVGDSARIVGDTGYVVRPKDPIALANAISLYIEKPVGERNILGKKARNRICLNYKLEQIVSKYENLYQSLLQ